jgi:hypothetical protein
MREIAARLEDRDQFVLRPPAKRKRPPSPRRASIDRLRTCAAASGCASLSGCPWSPSARSGFPLSADASAASAMTA